MSALTDKLIEIRCILLKYNPIRHAEGLYPIGNPGPDSPVFVSGNYFLAVKRLLRSLSGHDCWLLVADSAGINVWCAAGVCDFNEHKISDAVHSCDLTEKVSHRRLILPPLAAVGINLRILEKECGFHGEWGPVHAEDLPVWFAAGGQLSSEMSRSRFPLHERWINAVGVFFVFFPLALLLGLGNRRRRHFALLANGWNIFGVFLAYPFLGARYPANRSLQVGAMGAVLLCLHALLNPLARPLLRGRLLLGGLLNILVSIDMLGSTPFYKTTIGHWFSSGDNCSLFQPRVTDACTGCRACIAVCPKGILELNPDTRRVQAVLERECMECLACLKQCPVDAFENCGQGFKDDIKSVEGLEKFKRN